MCVCVFYNNTSKISAKLYSKTNLALPRAQRLKRQNLILHFIEGNNFAVDDEWWHFFFIEYLFFFFPRHFENRNYSFNVATLQRKHLTRERERERWSIEKKKNLGQKQLKIGVFCCGLLCISAEEGKFPIAHIVNLFTQTHTHTHRGEKRRQRERQRGQKQWWKKKLRVFLAEQ